MKFQQGILKNSMAAVLAAGMTIAPFAGADERTGNTYIAPAEALTADAPALADQLASAIVNGNTAALCLQSATLSGVNAQGHVFTAPISLAGFPTGSDTSFGVLSSGIASAANAPNASTFVSTNMGGPSLPPGAPQSSPDNLTSLDVVTLTLTFGLPSNPGSLSFDWKLGSDEPPTFTTGFPDYFRADVTDLSGTSNIAMFPGPIAATARNMVLNGFSNAPTGSSNIPAAPFPTPNDNAFNAVANSVQVASYNLGASGPNVSVAFRVADVNDSILDTAALIDSLKIDACDTVGIDIKPHSDPNSINACSNGAVPVAILGSEVLDVTQIDPGTVTLADAGVKMVGKSDKLLCSTEDVNADGYDDLVCHMVTVDLGLDSGDTVATVTAQLYSGGTISGSDSVNIVKDECN